ncbi:MAG: hypothetical protein H0V20_02670, partial [Actinobacteria bacterium]|nr:hypothetical protein [Actinomycetota bacterium]
MRFRLTSRLVFLGLFAVAFAVAAAGCGREGNDESNAGAATNTSEALAGKVEVDGSS